MGVHRVHEQDDRIAHNPPIGGFGTRFKLAQKAPHAPGRNARETAALSRIPGVLRTQS